MKKSTTLSDLDALYVRFCKGDRRAQNQLYEKTEQRLFRYIRSKTNVSEDEIAEIMQNTWRSLWRACSGDNTNSSFLARMHETAKSRVIDHIRYLKADKRTSYEESLHNEKDEDLAKELNKGSFNKHISIDGQKDKDGNEKVWELPSSNDFEELALVDAIKKALTTLPPEQRQAWMLMQDGYTNKQIAELTDCNEERAKSRVRYANDKLKALLGITKGKHDGK